MTTARVSLKNVSVLFPMHLDERAQSFRYALGSRLLDRRSKRRYKAAMNNVSITARPGDKIGIIGRNGAGKTSLLRTIAGIYEPDQGTIYRYGKTISLINLSMGMDMYATGIENVRLRSILYGMSEEEIEQTIENVIHFSELKEALNAPIRTYSSGMLARLAFSIATSVKADIILMDEWISAGDARFIDRAEARMAQFIGEDKIVFLASHSAGLIRKWCNKVMVLDHGQVVYLDEDINGGIDFLKKLMESPE